MDALDRGKSNLGESGLDARGYQFGSARSLSFGRYSTVGFDHDPVSLA